MSIKDKISATTNISDCINIAQKYYSKINLKHKAEIFNSSIVYNEFCQNDYSAKLLIELAILLIASHKNKLIYKKKILLLDERDIFLFLSNKIFELYCNEQIEQSLEYGKKYMDSFLAYTFDFPTISTGDYIHFFKTFEVISKKIFGFSLYKSSLNYLNLFATNCNNENYFINNLFTKKQLNSFLSEKEIKELFITTPQSSLKFPTDVPFKLNGKIGINVKDLFFIPQSKYMYYFLYRKLVESDLSNNSKGIILEKETKQILEEYFGQQNVFNNLYDKHGNEQDFIIIYNQNIILLECKARDFKEVFRNQNKSKKRLEQQFNKIIEGCKQCQRAKDYIVNENHVQFYNNDTNNHSVKLSINSNNKNILKIVVTMDDYLNLSESSHEFENSKNHNYLDTWIVNFFALKRILWATKSNKSELINYIQYRTSNIKTIFSMHSDELDQFGYYKSNSYSGMIPENDIGISIILKDGFSDIFYKYDEESLIDEINKLQSLS